MSSRPMMVVALAVVLGGCAAAHLQVAIDIYDEDPRFAAPMSPEETVQQIQDVEKLQQAASDRTSERQFLATVSQNIYVSTLETVSTLDDPDIERVTTEYSAFISDTNRALALLEPRFAYAKAVATQYLSEYQAEYALAADHFNLCEGYRVSGKYQHQPNPDEQKCHVSEFTKKVERLDREWILRRLPVCLRAEEAKVRAAVADAAGAYRSFASPAATVEGIPNATQTFTPAVDANSSEKGRCPQPITASTVNPAAAAPGPAPSVSDPARPVAVLFINWASLRARLNLALEGAQLGGMRAIERKLTMAIQSFNAGMTSLAAASKLVPQEDIAKAVEARSQRSVSGLLDSSLKIALELESVRADLPESASAQTALAGLARNSSQFTELIDRLQDAGTPVWRIVTDPANEEHWNKSPAQTDFFAEGKSSVVLVRNDPMRFDVHDATNNPTALIKGQLEVSRAVANAAISIAGASAGVPAPKPAANASGTTDTAASTTTPPSSDTATDFAKRKAAADEAQRLRDQQIRGLDLELSAILASLATASTDTVSDSQKARLDAVLSAYKAMFEAASK